jgi:putative ABC transport system permease protein
MAIDWHARLLQAFKGAKTKTSDISGEGIHTSDMSAEGIPTSDISGEGIHTSDMSAEGIPDAEVIEELSQHAAAVYDGARADGCTPAQAERHVSALIDRWATEAPKLRHRARRPRALPPPSEDRPSRRLDLWQDVKYAWRLVMRQPRFASLVVLTMALGIGSTTTLFSVTYGVLVKPLPWPGADRLVVLKEKRGGRPPRFGSFSNTAYFAWREKPELIEDLAAWAPRTSTLSDSGGAERIRAAAVTASLFRITAARPVAGVLFDDRDESSPVIVLSEGLWRRRFGGNENVLGKSVQLDGESRTVIGVLPDAMGYPDRLVKAWVPFRVSPPNGNLLSMFEAIARLRPGVTAEQAAAEGTARGQFAANTGMTTMAIFGGDGAIEVGATPLADALTAEVRRPLLVLLVAVGLLLVIAATNIASLQLARATARRRELAIRASIGASHSRLVRQLVIENLLIGLIGGAAGLGVAWALHQSAPAILPSDFPRTTDLALDAPVLLFATTLSIVTSVCFGLVLAFRLRRLNLVASLAEDGVSPVGAAGRSSVARARMLIVTAQTAIACLLLVGALLLGRSFFELLHADRGYEPRQVLVARVSLPATQYSPDRRSAVLGEMIDHLARIPAVRAAAFTTELPITPGGSTSAFTLPSRDATSGTIQVQASPRIVSPGYFAALDLAILAGRPLADTDTATSEPVLLVNETFQRRYLPGGAVGAKLPMALWGQNQYGDATVVGVVEDVRYIGATTTSLAELYFSFRQLKAGVRPTTAALLIRTDGDPRDLAGLLRSAVARVDPSIVPDGALTLEDRLLAFSLARPRLYAVLLAAFAVLALTVTGVGLFSVLSYTVTLRTRELGVRAALGARQSDLVRLVLGQGLIVAAGGTVLGLVASVWLTRFIATLLFGITPMDMTTYATVPAVLLVVIVLACVAPARRAAKLDPLKALRS